VLLKETWSQKITKKTGYDRNDILTYPLFFKEMKIKEIKLNKKIYINLPNFYWR